MKEDTAYRKMLFCTDRNLGSYLDKVENKCLSQVTLKQMKIMTAVPVG
jgi:hypothetical protein